ncbi:MAG TPA: hypothetical protein VKK81_00680, partial [Candidatus Binatia bacterium]|nr:hypothetical protein [Candidatus Binatia bacterium]
MKKLSFLAVTRSSLGLFRKGDPMPGLCRRNILFVLAVALWLLVPGSFPLAEADDHSNKQSLQGRVVAVGIPGAS